jgi:hypothetical protein
MLRLMKKNAIYFISYAIGILSLMTVYWFTARTEISWAMVLFQGLWLILIVEGAVTVNEKAEEKTNAYDFLRTLPISDREIVVSKFILVSLTGIFVLVSNYAIYFFMPEPPYLVALGRIYLLFCFFAALSFAGISYIIIFRYGHSVFVKFVWITLIAIMVGPILLIELVLLKLDIDFRGIIDRMSELHGSIWIVMGLCGLAVYFLLMQAAIKAKQVSRR